MTEMGMTGSSDHKFSDSSGRIPGLPGVPPEPDPSAGRLDTLIGVLRDILDTLRTIADRMPDGVD
jgi:hypothetical protein